MYLLASYYEYVNTIRRVQTYLKGNSWSMFWETFLDPITFREIRKHNHILISMNAIRTPPWQQTNDWLTARKTKPYVMANDDVAKRQHIFLASLFARCYRSRYWKFEFTGVNQSRDLRGTLGTVSSIYIWSKNLVAKSEAKDGGNWKSYWTSVLVPCAVF